MNKVYILSAARTPMGVLDGNLRDYKEQNLGAAAMKLALERSGLQAGELSEVVAGTAKQTSLPSNLARYAVLEAGFPDTVPAYTVQRQSASGLQAVANAVWSIRSGTKQTVMAGGSESMTHIPREIHNARYSFNENTRIIFDPIAAQVAGAQPEDLRMEDINASLAGQCNIAAADMEAYLADDAAKAQRRTAKDYICKLQVRKGKVLEPVEADEYYQASAVLAKPADCAAMLVLTSAEGRSPVAELVSLSVTAGDPAGNGLVGAKAAQQALAKAGATLAGLKRIEIVELAAAQVLATIDELGLERTDARINPVGGGLITGNPWGASGAAQLVDMVHGLESGELGMVINPAEGGQVVCVLVRAL